MRCPNCNEKRRPPKCTESMLRFTCRKCKKILAHPKNCETHKNSWYWDEQQCSECIFDEEMRKRSVYTCTARDARPKCNQCDEVTYRSCGEPKSHICETCDNINNSIECVNNRINSIDNDCLPSIRVIITYWIEVFEINDTYEDDTNEYLKNSMQKEVIFKITNDDKDLVEFITYCQEKKNLDMKKIMIPFERLKNYKIKDIDNHYIDNIYRRISLTISCGKFTFVKADDSSIANDGYDSS